MAQAPMTALQFAAYKEQWINRNVALLRIEHTDAEEYPDDLLYEWAEDEFTRLHPED